MPKGERYGWHDPKNGKRRRYILTILPAQDETVTDTDHRVLEIVQGLKKPASGLTLTAYMPIEDEFRKLI